LKIILRVQWYKREDWKSTVYTGRPLCTFRRPQHHNWSPWYRT